jgi:hypothetical protein
MARLFDAYVMVDWSAASKPTTGADSVWIGIMRRNVRFQFAFEAHNPSTRAEAERQLDQLMKDFVKKSERALIGFDFALGFPRGAAAAMQLGSDQPWMAMWDYIAREVKDRPDNTNNRFQVGARMNRAMTGEAFPFWGAPAREEQTMLRSKRPRRHTEADLPELRLVDERARSSPVWQLYYQGSVGGQVLTGVPVVRRLRAERQGQAVVWPFETGFKALTRADLEGVDAVLCEIYPSLVKAEPRPGEVKDLAQVRAIAEHFQKLDDTGRLGALFGPRVDAAHIDAVAREEGWILGVA